METNGQTERQLMRPQRAPRWRRRVILVTVLSLLAVGQFTPQALADVVTTLDDDDSAGRLDVVAARHSHFRTESGRRWLRHRVVTYERWPTRMLEMRNTYIELRLIDRESGDQSVVFVFADDKGELQANFFRGTEPRLDRVGPVRVRRQDRHSLTLAFHRRYLGEVDTYQWRVLTSYQSEHSTECKPPGPDEPETSPPAPVCPDDTSWVTHRLH